MREKKVMKLASRGKRLGAYCIDAVIPIIASIMYLAATVAMMVKRAMNFGDFGFGYGYGYPGYGYGQSSGASTTMTIAVILWIAYLIAQIVFYRQSKTLGKAALGLQVVSSTDGEPIDFWKMLFREWFVKRASSSIFFLGYIWIAIDDKNRGWHDKILDTYVVDLKETEVMNRQQSVHHQERPTPKSAPLYTPQVSEAAGTSAAALADKEPETAGCGSAATEITPAGSVAEIKDSIIEITDVIAVTAKDAASKAKDDDQVFAETAADAKAETIIETEAETAVDTVAAAAEKTAEDVESTQTEIIKEEEPFEGSPQEAVRETDEQE